MDTTAIDGFVRDQATSGGGMTSGDALIAGSYAAKPDAYFAGARHDFVAALPQNPDARILEIGCGSGETAEIALGAGRCSDYAAIELDAIAAARARRVIPDVRIGNVETMELSWPNNHFDALILSEVLEHLVDPWRAMARLAPLVKPGGMVLASSPNIAHYSFALQLLRGRWDLENAGARDRTHLRWFTPSTYCGMIAGAGFDVVHVGPVAPFGPKARLLSAAVGGRFDHLLMRQIAVHAIRRA